MTRQLRIFTYLLVVAVVCLLAVYRHERAAANFAKQETAELKARLENLDGDLANIKEQFDQLQDAYSATLVTTVPPPKDMAEAMSRMAQLDAQRSNTLSFMQGLSDAIKQSNSLETAPLVEQEILAELTTKAAAQAEKVATAKSHVEELRNLLKVPDEVAALIPSTGLGTPDFANYQSYFEAKRDLEEASNLARLLKRRVQVAELDTKRTSARASESDE